MEVVLLGEWALCGVYVYLYLTTLLVDCPCDEVIPLKHSFNVRYLINPFISSIMSTATMTMPSTSLLDLPAEVRLNVYSHLFKDQRIFIDAGNYSGLQSMLPIHRATSHNSSSSPPESAQLLQVCRTLHNEAQPLLYEHLTFHVSTRTFAGSLPYSLTDAQTNTDPDVTTSIPSSPFLRHIIWQLQCDILKKFYFEDLKITAEQIANLETFEIRCRCAAWRDVGEKDLSESEKFTRGREQVRAYLAHLGALRDSAGEKYVVDEDESVWGIGEVRMSLVKQGSRR